MLLLMLLAIIATNSAWVAYELGIIRKALVKRSRDGVDQVGAVSLLVR
jgi:hypothetical protein